eukprot:11691290-Alexandrium_andersonii.AAC.1
MFGQRIHPIGRHAVSVVPFVSLQDITDPSVELHLYTDGSFHPPTRRFPPKLGWGVAAVLQFGDRSHAFAGAMHGSVLPD